MQEPKPGETWQHFKGQRYEIVGIAKHSETQEPLVIYRKGPDAEAWARPLPMFVEPAIVKPTKPGIFNCQHADEGRYTTETNPGASITPEGAKSETVMFCRACQEQAAIGRFVEVK